MGTWTDRGLLQTPTSTPNAGASCGGVVERIPVVVRMKCSQVVAGLMRHLRVLSERASPITRPWWPRWRWRCAHSRGRRKSQVQDRKTRAVPRLAGEKDAGEKNVESLVRLESQVQDNKPEPLPVGLSKLNFESRATGIQT